MIFKVGSKAVYPAHGVVKVESVESKEILGTRKDFYILQIVDGGATLMVPTDNTESVGLRTLITKRGITKIYKILNGKDNKSVQQENHQSWNRRYREYSDKLKSGDIFEIAGILKDIYHLQKDKDLSFGERKIMDSARSLLVKEISIAKDLEESLVSEEINKLLQQS